MTDLSQAQAGAQASASPEPLAPPEQPTETKPLTIADVERIAEEKATRIAQSMVDKAENRISRKAQEQIAAIDTSRQALGLSDEQVQQAKQRVIFDDLTAKPTAEQASPAPQTQTNQPAAEIDPVIQETLDVFKAEGVTIDTSDPEYKTLEAILRDPNGNIYQYRKALYTQIEAKRSRVAAAQVTAPARVLSGGQQTTGEANLSGSAHDEWQNVYKK